MNGPVIVCGFSSTDHLTGRRRTYEAVKLAALEAGMFSVFEATASSKNAGIFSQLERDPEVETFRNPPAFPWIGVRRRATKATP